MYESHIESLTVLCGFVSHLIDVQIYCIFLHLKDSQQVPVPHKAPKAPHRGHQWALLVLRMCLVPVCHCKVNILFVLLPLASQTSCTHDGTSSTASKNRLSIL